MTRNTYPRLTLVLLTIVMSLAVPASAAWKEKVLYSFQGGTDGAVPAGGVVFDKAGNLYGATNQGGANNCSPMADCGTVFQLTPPAKQGDPWTETVLHTFKGKQYNDGDSPNGGLVIDSQGNLYGVTGYGGTGDCVILGITGGCGTVYELSPPKQKGGAWTETILYSFPTSKQGYLPNGNLVFDSAGNLYGATWYGGTKGTNCDKFYGGQCGTVFELSPPKKNGGKWTEKVLHSFAGGTDGAIPNGGLVLDTKGAVYGTTYFGGYDGGVCGSGGCGTVFKLSPPTKKGGVWREVMLRRFNPGTSGAAGPLAGVVFRRSGNLYGTTAGGGNSGSGTVFQLAPRATGQWAEHVLYHFRDDKDGGHPQSRLLFDSKGNLYGTATGGGSVGNGTLFRLKPQAGSGRLPCFTSLRLHPMVPTRWAVSFPIRRALYSA